MDKHAYENEPPVLLCNYTDVYYNERITQHLPFMAATASEDQIAKFSLQAGDTIITKDSETADDIAISAYVPEDLEGVVCGYHLSIVRPQDGVCGAFIKRFFDASYTKACFAVAANGLTRVGLSQYAIDNVGVPVPPREEQEVIARFLDLETAKIDALIAEQERLIELLKEKRQAVISHAVTKGLDRNVKLKASGFEWIGNIPAHWKLRRLKHITPQITVGIVVEPSKYYVAEGVPALRSLNVKPGEVRLESVVYISGEANELHGKSKLGAGDLVMVRSGQPGTTAVVPPSLAGANCIDLVIVRAPTQATSEYLCWYLNSESAGNQVAAGSGGAIQQHFNVGMAENIVIPLPPADEAASICKELNKQSATIDALITAAQDGIALLRERRSALISAAVTGQIDVRGLAEQKAA